MNKHQTQSSASELLSYQFIEQLKALPFVDAIYLYGSRARGTQRPRSDLDIAVLCPRAGTMEWAQITDIVDDADTLLEIDCLRLDEEPLDSRLRQQIERDKKVIYERHAG